MRKFEKFDFRAIVTTVSEGTRSFLMILSQL